MFIILMADAIVCWDLCIFLHFMPALCKIRADDVVANLLLPAGQAATRLQSELAEFAREGPTVCRMQSSDALHCLVLLYTAVS